MACSYIVDCLKNRTRNIIIFLVLSIFFMDIQKQSVDPDISEGYIGYVLKTYFFLLSLATCTV